MHTWPADLLELLRSATIVVDNARRPALSATDAHNSMPALCWCEAPTTGKSATAACGQQPRKPSSRWESSPSQNVSKDKRCSNILHPPRRRPACLAKNSDDSHASSGIHAAVCTVVDSSFGPPKTTTTFPLRETTTLIHFKSTSVDQRPRPPPRRRSSSQALPSTTTTTTTATKSTPGGTHVAEALQQAIVLSHRQFDSGTTLKHEYNSEPCIVAFCNVQ
jgi:hypothetical protein